MTPDPEPDRWAELRRVIEKALRIGAISTNGDGWYAEEAGFDYDEQEAAFPAAREALATLLDVLASQPSAIIQIDANPTPEQVERIRALMKPSAAASGEAGEIDVERLARALRTIGPDRALMDSAERTAEYVVAVYREDNKPSTAANELKELRQLALDVVEFCNDWRLVEQASGILAAYRETAAGRER